mgnify:CR=1 FL=1
MKEIVFVCLGNICRSPMAEFVMKELDQGKSLHIESRATSSWEHGNPVHQGTQKILRKYAISFDSSKGSQQISRADFEFFDLVVGMDESNVEIFYRYLQGVMTIKSSFSDLVECRTHGTQVTLKKHINW